MQQFEDWADETGLATQYQTPCVLVYIQCRVQEQSGGLPDLGSAISWTLDLNLLLQAPILLCNRRGRTFPWETFGLSGLGSEDNALHVMVLQCIMPFPPLLEHVDHEHSADMPARGNDPADGNAISCNGRNHIHWTSTVTLRTTNLQYRATMLPSLAGNVCRTDAASEDQVLVRVLIISI